MAEQWLSIVEYARTFKVSDMTVRRRIKTGKLHAVLKEGKYFIPVQAEGGERKAAAPQQQTFARPAAPRSGEMTVVKGHPAAHATLSPPIETPMATQTPAVVRAHIQQVATRQPDFGDEHPEGNIPQSLSRPLAAHDTSLVDTRALLAFCEASLRKLNDSERRTVERFKSKLEALEANLLARDHEIKALRQQVEDLQLLVKILEGKG